MSDFRSEPRFDNLPLYAVRGWFFGDVDEKRSFHRLIFLPILSDVFFCLAMKKIEKHVIILMFRRCRMSYETVIEQVRTLPESLLISVSAFIKLLEAEQGEVFTVQTNPQTSKKQAFFDLAGKVHLDSASVTELREASLL